MIQLLFMLYFDCIASLLYFLNYHWKSTSFFKIEPKGMMNRILKNSRLYWSLGSIGFTCLGVLMTLFGHSDEGYEVLLSYLMVDGILKSFHWIFGVNLDETVYESEWKTNLARSIDTLLLPVWVVYGLYSRSLIPLLFIVSESIFTTNKRLKEFPQEVESIMKNKNMQSVLAFISIPELLSNPRIKPIFRKIKTLYRNPKSGQLIQFGVSGFVLLATFLRTFYSRSTFGFILRLASFIYSIAITLTKYHSLKSKQD